MVSFVLLAIGLSLVMLSAVSALLVVRRKRQPSTPAERYQRDMHKIQLETELGSKPRYSRQHGNPTSSPLTGTGF
jgi:hypothetical protein